MFDFVGQTVFFLENHGSEYVIASLQCILGTKPKQPKHQNQIDLRNIGS